MLALSAIVTRKVNGKVSLEVGVQPRHARREVVLLVVDGDDDVELGAAEGLAGRCGTIVRGAVAVAMPGRVTTGPCPVLRLG